MNSATADADHNSGHHEGDGEKPMTELEAD